MNITENKIFKATTSKTGKYARNFWMFLKNILILFRQNFKEVMLFLLFCTVFTATATSSCTLSQQWINKQIRQL